MSWNRICNIEETKIPIINGRKFTLKHFWGPNRGITVLNKTFLEFMLEKYKKGFLIARDNNTNVGNESYHIPEDFVAGCQSQ
jgi:hypothetical protein